MKFQTNFDFHAFLFQLWWNMTRQHERSNISKKYVHDKRFFWQCITSKLFTPQWSVWRSLHRSPVLSRPMAMVGPSIAICFCSWLIEIFLTQQQEQDPTNLYLSNLPGNFNEHDLEQVLLPFGQVISTRILRDNNGVSKGVGFAR